MCVYACLCLGTRKWHPRCSRPKPPEDDKETSESWVLSLGDRQICTGRVWRYKSLSMKDHPNRQSPDPHQATLEKESVLLLCVHQLTRLRSLRRKALGLCSHAAFPRSALFFFSSSSSSRPPPPLPPALCLPTRATVPEWRHSVCPVICGRPSTVFKSQTFWCRSDSWQHYIVFSSDKGCLRTLKTHKCTRA